MSARKSRPALGTQVTPGMSIRDAASALGVAKSELARWVEMGRLSDDEFESRLAYLNAHGLSVSSSALLNVTQPVPARGRVQRALGIVRVMTTMERAAFITEMMGAGW